MMKCTALLLALVAPPTMVASDLVLSQKIMDLTLTAAKLSSLAYEERAPADNVTGQFETFGYYDEEPDQALTVKTTDGYCFVAFRGTSLTWDDWKQNLQLGKKEICVDIGGEQKECCISRSGFYDAYNTGYRAKVEKSVRECAKSCTDMDDCVVITGHSQGGAIAAVAAAVLADLNPYTITFGQPATFEAPCELLTSERIFRYVNTKETETVGIAYDPIPMAPGLGADHFGNMIILSHDSSGVAYIGLDAQDYLHPYSVGVEAHFMLGLDTPYPGYQDRIEALMAGGHYPIRDNGYVAGSLCSEDKECQSKTCSAETTFSNKRCQGTSCVEDSACETDRCDSGVCTPKAGSCMPCDEDTDCAGNGKCLLYHCSNEEGLMDNNCICLSGKNCDSGRCEGVANPQCQARLSLGGSCNEDSDCKSDYCSWKYVCEDPTKVSGSGGVGMWILLSVLSAIGIYFVYKFVKERRSGYEEVPSIDV